MLADIVSIFFISIKKTCQSIFFISINKETCWYHYCDIIMGVMVSEITSLTIVYLTIYSRTDQRKHLSSLSLAFVQGIHRSRWIPTQMASNAENVSIWWHYHVCALNVDRIYSPYLPLCYSPRFHGMGQQISNGLSPVLLIIPFRKSLHGSFVQS